MSRPTHAGIGMTSARTRDRLVQRLREQGIVDPRVLEQVRVLPRHIFVDEALASRAYEDTALPIGWSQTISQPFIVARMTEALAQGGPLLKVLEIGTGCGYQTAMLSPFAERIYSIERVEPLLRRAKERIAELDIRNIKVGPEGQQQLVRLTRRESGIHRENLGPVAFVPLLGGLA